MSTATALQRIKRGLAASGHKSNFQSLDAVIGCPLDFKSLSETVHTVLNRRDALKEKAATLNKRLESFEATTRAELAETGIVRERLDNGATRINDLWGDDRRKVELQKRVNARRAELTAEIEESRAGAMRALTEAMGRLDTVRNLWTDAPAFLDRNTVGDSGRRIFKQNLEGAHPKKIENAIKQAVATGNRVMVAAALDVLDGMAPEDANQVNIDRHEASALAIGADFAKANHFVAAADLALLEAQLADAEIAGTRTAGIKTRIGLKRREVAAWSEDFDPAAIATQIEEGSGDE